MSHKPALSLFIFIDALGWEIVRNRSFLEGLLKTKVPLGTIFGYSSSCDPTILTGKLPREHGHFSFFYYNPPGSPFGACRFLAVLPKFITRRGRVRRVMSKLIQRYYGYTGYFQIYNMPFRQLPLFDYSEKRDIFLPGGINSGDSTIFDYLSARSIPFHRSDWHVGEELRLRALAADIEKGDMRWAYLILGDIDAVLHQYGTQAREVDEKIAWYDRHLRRLLQLAEKNYREIRFFIFSDHGMTDITADCDLMSTINRLNLRFGVDYSAVYDSTMARFWFLQPHARDKITEALQQVPTGKILSQEDLTQYGCNFSNNQYGELFFLMNPGVLICPSFMGEKSLAGMHGYDPQHPASLASFMSNCSFDCPPQGLEDLYGLMRREADISLLG